MDRSSFLKLLAKEFYPVLRAEGFRGSGTTVRRIDEPLIHVFNVQGSSSGGRFYMNLGAHLSFLPPEGGQAIAPALLQEAHCIFRDRIDPPTGQQFGWAYGKTPEEAAEIVEFIISEWQRQAQPFFQRYGTYPASFLSLLSQVNRDEIHPRTSLHYSRIADHLGMIDRAITFAKAGLAKTPEAATYLRRDLNELLEKLTNG
jgi:hypothetical protein